MGGSYPANRGTEVATQRMLVAMQISSVCIRIFPSQQGQPRKRLIFLKHGGSYTANRGTEVATQRMLVAMQISSVCIRIFPSQQGKPRKRLLFLVCQACLLSIGCKSRMSVVVRIISQEQGSP